MLAQCSLSDGTQLIRLLQRLCCCVPVWLFTAGAAAALLSLTMAAAAAVGLSATTAAAVDHLWVH